MGLGCNNLGRRIDEQRSREVVLAALDEGITLLDTADIYGDGRSEEFLGRILQGRRDQVVLATKFGMAVDRGGGAPSYVRTRIEDSLRRLQTDRIDLYQLHQPDPATPVADTLGVLAELVAEGLVREIGCSNFSAEQLREAEAAVAEGAPRFVSVQNELNLLDRADVAEALPEAERLGLAYIPYFPLASGLLTGKFRRGEPPPAGTRIANWPEPDRAEALSDERFDRIEAFAAYAAERGRTLLELAFAWLLSRPVVASVIAGATRVEQVRANAAAGDWRLREEELASLSVP